MQKKSRLINDTIYRHIECSDLEDTLLQTKIVNRLLFITQNALAYFSYPSINTKRYIHCLGTMHLSAHMYKNALINADDNVKNQFIKQLQCSIKKIITQEALDISTKDTEYFQDNALYEFMIPLRSKKGISIYLITLQALRIAALLHDVGHLPFSHQVEDAMNKIYTVLQKKEFINEKEGEFIYFYETATKNSTLVLHEAIGDELIKLLFRYELIQNKYTIQDKAYIQLIFKIVSNILNGHDDGIFNYKVLHKFIDSTVDADRLDYVNRDLLASGYISGAADYIRITKQSVLISDKKNQFDLSFFDSEIIDIEHMLEMRFNLYKKFIFNHKIAITDCLLENMILFLAKRYFEADQTPKETTQSIAMLWQFLNANTPKKRLDTISQLDENWIITLFKKEYFKIQDKPSHDFFDKKHLISFEAILFGKKFYNSIWKNLNDLYKVLNFDKIERYKFRESFGYVSKSSYLKLQNSLDTFCQTYENSEQNIYFTYRIVSLNIGIDKKFFLYDNENKIHIDEISTIRKRLKKSALNTVPFYLYSNKTSLTPAMKTDIKKILQTIFL